jgi:hypothetical protein
MLTIVVFFVCSVTILVVLLLVVVVFGIRQEPQTEVLSPLAPSLIAAFVRRVLGLHVRKPYPPPNLQGATTVMPHCATPPSEPMDKRRR